MKYSKQSLAPIPEKIHNIFFRGSALLKKSDYAMGLKEEAIKKNIFFASFSNDNFELVMRFVNKMALEENYINNEISNIAIFLFSLNRCSPAELTIDRDYKIKHRLKDDETQILYGHTMTVEITFCQSNNCSSRTYMFQTTNFCHRVTNTRTNKKKYDVNDTIVGYNYNELPVGKCFSRNVFEVASAILGEKDQSPARIIS
ncbi:hypothetical protein H8356DRAFT_1341550 [Neocallimastix lanati (nom. inval.)]|nr:hypothetical protein H8356DRAFT_1341550 [Neocallimastix sp. JGI-2020a]